ncbi:type II toxin-antitoxin system prevent-host-death family antitoxin [Allokutzneria sp. A3M-2-11 16]|uniref:type II toxin-antitoxin system Phd/YefM family antitoxin n=1 Tax=Allokutzneria sp. A3M-2-11 16 TaxID=2962043 RepID=UPI0020B86A7D|nr:type II toxin-antitoxin system prevent-host-death family antitoxin [Allokutzneria sp. A3M-2-11 16]MCP3798153.1 type II toxin-antitoxin system prevent-host-death family antitoxin [Allokutzneria sp. A3M-2-11 16]
MTHTIGQRELRNENAEIMRRVEAGETFTVTRNGKPVADLVPHRSELVEPAPRPTLGAIQEAFRRLGPIDTEQWYRDRAEADAVFGDDDPLEDPWSRQDQRTR